MFINDISNWSTIVNDARISLERILIDNKTPVSVTVAERSKAWTVFARSEAGIMGSNPTQGMDVWC
jgi:hypothetical protein